jgi:site-specific recombinase XerD
MEGNEDRRGPVRDYARILDRISSEVDLARDADEGVRESLSPVRDWLDHTGVTGYYKTERDAAEAALRAALPHATTATATARISRALALFKYIP